jgi:hypothetical protein
LPASGADLARKPLALSLDLVLLATIGVLALGLRLYQLSGRSLWLDEIFQPHWAHVNTIQDLVAESGANVNQMPLSYVPTWLLRPWGDDEFIDVFA